MKKTVKFISAILAVLMILSSVFVLTASADDDAYKAELIAKGFPEDYAVKLTALHKRHPKWNFEPLNVTQMSREMNKSNAYTWEYVLYMETDDSPKRSLVYNSDTYKKWRHPAQEQYDSGWWRASIEAVSYFLDPRNFLTEEQIFQFYDLKWNDSMTLSAVEAVVKGTFMENKKLDDKYSNTTYAQYFYDIGKELGANPVYLASRVRAEQGSAGTSPLINGNVGDKLWYYYSNKMTGKDEAGHIINAPTSGYTQEQLLSYNGYYNYFNIGSAGTGYFNIYKNGIDEAKKGTESKKSEWDGDASWNKHWKSIYGGAYSATNRYINDYQNVPYLQKFNVDPRSSRNFWGQYMQSITGAQGMATQSYNSFKTNDMLGLSYDFLIPVYEGMPADPCPHPDTLPTPTDYARMTDCCVDSNSFANDRFNALGWTGSNFAIKRLGYSIDGGATVWSGVSKVDFANADDESAIKARAGVNAVRFRASIKDKAFTIGDHTVMIMAEVNDGKNSVIKVLSSAVKVTVTSNNSAQAFVTNSYVDRENDSAEGRELCFFTDESETVWYVKGWFGVNYDAEEVGYSIDGKDTVYDKSVTFKRDTGLDPHVNGGIGYRFECNIDTSNLKAGEHTLVINVLVDHDDTVLNALGNRVITVSKTVSPETGNDTDESVTEDISETGTVTEPDDTETAPAETETETGTETETDKVTMIKGDVNDDGEVDNKDVVALFRYVSSAVSSSDYVSVLDYNDDGNIDNKDVVALFRALSTIL